MSGSVRILPEEQPEEKHDHIDLVFRDGKVLRYTDPRRFGAWLWCEDSSHQLRISPFRARAAFWRIERAIFISTKQK